ncbi:thioesterase family protein [Smaragdicoccus niigatensis]
MRWTDCDLLGHVNNAKFIEFAQDARIRFFGEDSTITWGRDNSMVVRHMEVDYERPLFLTSSPIHVDVSILKIGNSSCTIRHDICDKDGNRAARVDAVLVGFDGKTNTSKPLSDEIKTLLSKYLVES